MYKNILFSLFCAFFFVTMTSQSFAASKVEKFKPFVLANVSLEEDFQSLVNETRKNLVANGFQLVGEYEPYSDSFVKNAKVLIVTSPELLDIAKASHNGGFAAPWRVAITQTQKNTQVSYVNPLYIKHAYHLDGDMHKVADQFKLALGEQKHFGSKNGLSARKLAKYRYTIGMERFHNVYLLAQHDSHSKAISVLEAKLADNKHGLGQVYRLDIDDNTSIFGISRKGPDLSYRYVDDHYIMQTVDFKEHKGTAYLPYEIMVKDNQIIALHMRFRMALHYPDLSMMGKHSFMTLRPSPKEIAWAFGNVARASE